MGKEKTKWTDEDTISAFEETELSVKVIKNNKVNDRPAIFIEDIQEQNQYKNSIKSG